MDHISSLYFFSGILGAILILLILTKNRSKNSTPFILLILVASYYSITYGIELLLNKPDLILSTIRFEYLGIAIIPALWLIFIINYIRRDKLLKPLTYALLFTIPVIVIIVSQSPLMIPLLYQSADFVYFGNLMLISIQPGPVYLLNFAYFIIAFISGILMLVDFLRHTQGIISQQIKIVILSGIVMLLAFLCHVLWLGPAYHIDITPLAYLFTLLMAFVALFYYRLFSLVPVAYDSVFQMIPTGLIVIDKFGYVIEANGIAEKTLNCNIRKNAGKLLTDYCPKWTEFNNFIEGVVNKGLKEQDTEISCKIDGEYTIYNLQTTYLKDRHGNIEGAIVAIRDITLEKNAEKEIKDSEKRFRELFEESPVAYVALNEKGRIVEVNPEFTRMTGYTEKEVLNKYFLDFILENVKSEILKKYHEFCKTGYISLDLEIKVKDEKLLMIFLSGRIQYDIGGKHVRTHCVLHDITEIKMTEKALSQANAKLNLLSNITRHDILNQITVLKGFLELAEEHISNSKNPDPVLMKYIEKELAATDNIYQQIQFTADYQGIGIQSPLWQNVNNTFANSIIGINPENITISTDVGELEIYADPLLEKVFYNLVENSLKYGDKITRTSLYTENSENGLVLKYTDDGVGIPAEEKENIFLRKYFRHSGLGMFLSREILAITGITLKETGVPGKGVVFEIFIPEGKYRQ
ncbi:MAG: histidine kinase N-terminal 7TM domain-containing protein [Methanomicrobium sp.]|nr:histidine kinase N-terminal 7TM domain-containing protein [Methanomicrobium sp.]